ncbi:MAG TPA: hypothetical protein DCF44_09405 [Chitinophagaceae bacterium]|nr:hypothetical protein [Chitinophagaceae bacterium]
MQYSSNEFIPIIFDSFTTVSLFWIYSDDNLQKRIKHSLVIQYIFLKLDGRINFAKVSLSFIGWRLLNLG